MLKNLVMKNRFSRLNGVENVSNMFQPIQNIIFHDRKHILNLYKSHKGRLSFNLFLEFQGVGDLEIPIEAICFFFQKISKRWALTLFQTTL